MGKAERMGRRGVVRQKLKESGIEEEEEWEERSRTKICWRGGRERKYKLN